MGQRTHGGFKTKETKETMTKNFICGVLDAPEGCCPFFKTHRNKGDIEGLPEACVVLKIDIKGHIG
jgi:hypothetical protein